MRNKFNEKYVSVKQLFPLEKFFELCFVHSVENQYFIIMCNFVKLPYVLCIVKV